MTVYPVTPVQFKKVTGRPSSGERGRIVVIPEVAALLPQFMAHHSRKMLGIDIKDGTFSEKGEMYGSKAKVVKFLEKFGEDLVFKKCSAVFPDAAAAAAKAFPHQKLTTSGLDVKTLFDPVPVAPCFLSIDYILSRRISDGLMSQLEDNLLLLKETRKQVAKEKKRKRAEDHRQAKQSNEAKDVAQAVLLLKQHGLDVVTISKEKS